MGCIFWCRQLRFDIIHEKTHKGWWVSWQQIPYGRNTGRVRQHFEVSFEWPQNPEFLRELFVLLGFLCVSKAVSPLMLWSQIIYGHRTAFYLKNIVRFYGARPAAGRIVRFFSQLFRHHMVPGKVKLLLKIPRRPYVAFCRVIEGTMTSAGHRLHTSDGHRTILVWNSNRTILTAVVHRTMCEKSKEL